jgi:hypothetical protein
MIPTPTTMPEAPNKNANTNGPKNLLEVAQNNWNPGQMWPTPTRRDYKGTNSPEGLTRKDGKSRMDQLPNAVAYGGTKTHQKWGTPRCFMYKDALKDRGKGNLGEQVNERENVKKTGQLNPPWVEWLMGWPVEWTDLKPLETDRYQQWQQQHGIYFHNK